jgi:GDP-4-dehydro-6-deoxy-D-mannose reductase
MKRVLMSGAGGFFAGYFAEFLRARGVELTLIGRAARPGIDYTTPEAWVSELERSRPDAVLHLAGCMSGSDVASFYRVNVGFGAALFEAARRSKYPADNPILVMSSAAEVGNAPEADRPIPESAPSRPLGHYGVSKAAQTELALLESRSRAVVVARAFNLVGPGMPTSLSLGHFAASIAAVARQGGNGGNGAIRVGNLSAVRDFIDARDAVRLCWALLSVPAARGRVTNVASGVGVRIHDALTTLIDVSGCAVQVELDPARMKPADVPFSIGSTDRLTELTGPLDLIPLRDSLKSAYDAALATAL